MFINLLLHLLNNKIAFLFAIILSPFLLLFYLFLLIFTTKISKIFDIAPFSSKKNIKKSNLVSFPCIFSLKIANFAQKFGNL